MFMTKALLVVPDCDLFFKNEQFGVSCTLEMFWFVENFIEIKTYRIIIFACMVAFR